MSIELLSALRPLINTHWIAWDANNNLILKAALIGFHHLTGAHMGKNIAEAIMSLIVHACITSKIGHFTLNNALKNAAAMKELQELLVEHEVTFHHLNNHIMCYPHIINICTTHIISASTQASKKYLDSNGLNGDNDNNFDPISPHCQTGPKLDNEFIASQPPGHQAWLRSLKSDPIKHVVYIICYICASDARKQTSQGSSGNALPLQLIQHVKTQWDSVYLMIQYIRAVEVYFAEDLAIKSMKLSPTDWELLESIEVILETHRKKKFEDSWLSMPEISQKLSHLSATITPEVLKDLKSFGNGAHDFSAHPSCDPGT
ncbi:hypothetical protein EDB86DRAFT_3084313 [Lactarius hatsudake]|nr:hypothetical protein EDB86DRAFT_3084313 [Lactarius hatsudake]